MDFKDQIKQLGDRTNKLKDNIGTEEATKNAFVMPFIQVLGYDVFNPIEVIPEYITDIGTKKGEKIDYAILKDGVPIIIIECKHWKENLNLHDGQLLRYFHVSKAKFGILTNGICYRFYTDLLEPNKMDEKPFLEFNINEVKEGVLEELKKFHKAYFEIDKIVATANDLKYLNEIYNLINNELKSPSQEFLKFILGRIYEGSATEKIRAKFYELVKKSSAQLVSDLIAERLKTALDSENKSGESISLDVVESLNKEKKIVTTEDELEAYYIIKSMLRQRVDPVRITHRDGQTYFSVNLDDNSRKSICRLFLNGNKKSLHVLDATKAETKIDLKTIDDLYMYKDQLEKSLISYLELSKAE